MSEKKINIGPDIINGPESMPLKEYIKDLSVTVTVWQVAEKEGEDDQELAKTEINYGDPNHRKWLGKITYWAISNGHIVETRASK